MPYPLLQFLDLEAKVKFLGHISILLRLDVRQMVWRTRPPGGDCGYPGIWTSFATGEILTWQSMGKYLPTDKAWTKLSSNISLWGLLVADSSDESRGCYCYIAFGDSQTRYPSEAPECTRILWFSRVFFGKTCCRPSSHGFPFGFERHWLYLVVECELLNLGRQRYILVGCTCSKIRMLVPIPSSIWCTIDVEPRVYESSAFDVECMWTSQSPRSPLFPACEGSKVPAHLHGPEEYLGRTQMNSH
jgi:hypothetical protein